MANTDKSRTYAARMTTTARRAARATKYGATNVTRAGYARMPKDAR